MDAFGEACWDGVCLRYPGEPIDRCFGTVLSAFHQLATYTGYVAAEIHASGGTRTLQVDAGARLRLLGPAWDDVVDALRAIPPATTAMALHELEALAWEIAGHVERWLDHVGFTLQDLPDGGTYLDVLRHDFEPPFEQDAA